MSRVLSVVLHGKRVEWMSVCVSFDETEVNATLWLSPSIFLSFPAVSRATTKTASQLRVFVWNAGWHLPLSNVNITASNDSYLNRGTRWFIRTYVKLCAVECWKARNAKLLFTFTCFGYFTHHESISELNVYPLVVLCSRSKVKSSDQWEVTQGCQSSLSPFTHTPHHIVRKQQDLWLYL